jgi:hypothetical protein
MVDDRRKDGELSERVVRMETQVGRLVSDAESEKDTRRRVNQDIDKRFTATDARLSKIERTIWTAAGALAVIIFAIEFVVKKL